MSDTPRTQKARGFHDLETAVAAEEMERLERELNAATAENATMREVIKEAQSAISAFLGFHLDGLTNAQVASLSETLQNLHHQTK